MTAQSVRVLPRPGARRRLRATTLAGGLIAIAVLVLAGCANSSGGGQAAQSSAPGHTARPQSASSPSSSQQTTAAVKPGTKSGTVVRKFVPYTSSGAPVAGVTARRSGSCFTASIVVPRRNSYRCLAGNALLDPCFAKARSAKTLACFTAPWSKVTQLRLTKSLASSVPDPTPTHVTRPWAIALSGGVRCVAGSGTAEVKQGVAMTYTCANGGVAGLVQSPTTHRKALYAPHGKPARRVAVTVEWVTSA